MLIKCFEESYKYSTLCLEFIPQRVAHSFKSRGSSACRSNLVDMPRVKSGWCWGKTSIVRALYSGLIRFLPFGGLSLCSFIQLVRLVL